MTCTAALNLAGEHFGCDWPTDARGRHDGWDHANKPAQAVWRGTTDTTLTTLRAALIELHADSGEPITHWCSRFGGSEEPAHEPDAPNHCDECGSMTPWPCPTYRLAASP